MKLTLRKAVFSAIAALALMAVPMGFAQTNNPTYPFHGIVGSVDNTAKAVTLKQKKGDRVLKIDSTSKLSLEGKPATLSQVTTNLYVSGTVHKLDGEQEYIVTAKFSKEPPAKRGASTNSVPDAASTNAPPKKHKKMPAPDSTATNSVPN